MAIASLSLTIVSPIFAVFQLILGFNVHAALALPLLLGLLLAHVAFFRIRASQGALGGIGFARAAMTIGYVAIALVIALLAVLVYVIDQFKSRVG